VAWYQIFNNEYTEFYLDNFDSRAYFYFDYDVVLTKRIVLDISHLIGKFDVYITEKDDDLPGEKNYVFQGKT
jgi:hypothetical protein